MVDPASSVISLEIPGYRVQRELGAGGMARVYLATQESLEREVAVKVLSNELVSDSDFCRRFLKEGKVLAQITHPHVVTIFDSGEHQGVFYMCMELIRGGTLEDRISSRELSLIQSIEIIKQVASALEWSHGKGLIHRDIKPGNVLFRDSRTAVLSDFGIAKSISKNTTRMTDVGLAIGTPTYMSPEQASAKELTAASDQYSLGVMFFEMLTGRVPYDGETGVAIAVQHLQAPVPKLPEEHASLQPIIERMMAKSPDDRFNTLEEMIVALEQSIAKPDTARSTEVIKQPKQALPGGRPMVLGAAGIAAAALIAGGAYLMMQPDASTEPPAQTASSAPAPPPASSSSNLDAATQQEVDKWLDIAETHYSIGRMTDPPGNNALEAYWKVLELDAGNARAQQGLRDIADTYEQLARDSLTNNGEPEEVRTLINQGLRAFPEHQGLARLREQVSGG